MTRGGIDLSRLFATGALRARARRRRGFFDTWPEWAAWIGIGGAALCGLAAMGEAWVWRSV